MEASAPATARLEVVSASSTASRSRFLRFVVDHEDRWLFVVLYVGTAVALSILLSLFWLVVLLILHAAMEWIREHMAGTRGVRILRRTLWAVKLDAALLVLALALSLYMETIVGLLGLRAAAQVGSATRIGTRAAAWTRGIRAALLTVDDAAQVVRAAARSRKTTAAHHSHDGWTWEDRIAIGIGVACLALIVIAPFVLGFTLAETAARLGRELHPWP